MQKKIKSKPPREQIDYSKYIKEPTKPASPDFHFNIANKIRVSIKVEEINSNANEIIINHQK